MRAPLSITVGFFLLLLVDDTDEDGVDGLLVALGVLASAAVIAVTAGVDVVFWFVSTSRRVLLVGCSSGDVHGWNPTRP